MPESMLVNFTVAEFAVDQEARTISGRLLPFGEVSKPASDGRRYSFTRDQVDLPDLGAEPNVLNYGHDQQSLHHQLGSAVSLAAKDDGVHVTYRIAKTPEGDRVLALAHPDIKALRSFSAEVEGAFEADKDGVYHPTTTAKVTGGAVVPKPAFIGADITHVAASAAQKKENDMPEVDTATPVAFTKADGDALVAQVTDLATKLAALEDIKIPVGPGTASTQVKEEPIYRFEGTTPAPSGFDFATDLLLGVKGDAAALDRLNEFTSEQMRPGFADQPTTTGDTATINPSVYRPDMFLGQAPTPRSPLYDLFYKGSLANVTPFFWAKLDRTNTDVGVADHTEDTNPESRDIVTTTGATVTPTPMSGRVHLTREVADQGGNPQVSGLIKKEFDRSFAIALETKTAALLTAAAGGITALATPAAGADGVTLGRAIEDGLVGLQFLPDGFRFTNAYGHIDLYKALAGAIIPQYDGDTVGVRAYPIINPQNRDGQTASKYASINIAGYDMLPAASLGATSGSASNSYVCDPGAVFVWNSGLTELSKLSETVAGWDIAVFAYFAGAVYDTTGLRKIAYDPTA